MHTRVSHQFVKSLIDFDQVYLIELIKGHYSNITSEYGDPDTFSKNGIDYLFIYPCHTVALIYNASDFDYRSVTFGDPT